MHCATAGKEAYLLLCSLAGRPRLCSRLSGFKGSYQVFFSRRDVIVFRKGDRVFTAEQP